MTERKKIKLKKTRGGAQQYGSGDDFEKQGDLLFNKFMSDGSISDPDLVEKMNMLEAGKYATRGYDDDGSFERQQKDFAKKRAKKRRKRPVKKKEGGLIGGQKKLDKNKDGKISGADFKMMKKGGEVKKMKGGGAVCRGGGAAVSGMKFSGVR